MNEYAVVIDVVVETVEEAPPLLHDQTSLEIAANSEHGMSAEETLAASQELYEAGLISYPRTSSHNITADMVQSVSALLANGEEGDSGGGGSPGGGGNGSGGGGSPGGGENDSGSGVPSVGGNDHGNTAPRNAEGDIIRDGSQLVDDKLKPNCTYQTGEYDYVYKTDSEGRIKNWSTDNLKLTEREKRLTHDKNTPGKEKGDHAGHLAGDRFGGSPKIDNLVSQSSNVNLSQYKKLENQWDKAIEAGKHVKVNVDVIYEGDSLRPSKFSIKYEIDGEVFRKTILN